LNELIDKFQTSSGLKYSHPYTSDLRAGCRLAACAAAGRRHVIERGTWAQHTHSMASQLTRIYTPLAPTYANEIKFRVSFRITNYKSYEKIT